MTTSEISAWLVGRVPDEWFTTAPTAEVDRDEIVIVGTLPVPAPSKGASDVDQAAVVAGRVRRFRETTRDQRIAIARELEHAYGRKVAWAVDVDGDREGFTALAIG